MYRYIIRMYLLLYVPSVMADHFLSNVPTLNQTLYKICNWHLTNIFTVKKRTNGYIFHQNDECYNMTLYFSTKSDPKKKIIGASRNTADIYMIILSFLLLQRPWKVENKLYKTILLYACPMLGECNFFSDQTSLLCNENGSFILPDTFFLHSCFVVNYWSCWRELSSIDTYLYTNTLPKLVNWDYSIIF